MGTHNVAEAASELRQLIDRALKGELVVISLDCRPVVELRPIPQASTPGTEADIEWVEARRGGKAQTSHAASWAVFSCSSAGQASTPSVPTIRHTCGWSGRITQLVPNARGQRVCPKCGEVAELW